MPFQSKAQNNEPNDREEEEEKRNGDAYTNTTTSLKSLNVSFTF